MAFLNARMKRPAVRLQKANGVAVQCQRYAVISLHSYCSILVRLHTVSKIVKEEKVKWMICMTHIDSHPSYRVFIVSYPGLTCDFIVQTGCVLR